MNFKTQYQFAVQYAKSVLSYVLSYLPRRLPQGMAEFSHFAEEVIRLAGLPDNDSTRFAVAVQIMHLGPTESNKPKRYFVRTLQKGAAAQVAGCVMQDLKDKQKAAQLAAAATNTEAPASSGADSGQAKQA